MKKVLVTGLLLLIISGAVLLYRCEHAECFATPLWATQTEILAKSDSAAPQAWLHVLVETDYGWLWQKSTAKAFTSSDKDGKQRVKVGKLCVKLEAHDLQQQCVENADSLIVSEKKRGIFIKKKRATMWAWSENPKLEMTTTFLDP